MKAAAKPRQAQPFVATTIHPIQEGTIAAVLAKLKLAIALDFDAAEAHYQLGRTLRLKHENAATVQEFKRAFEVN